MNDKIYSRMLLRRRFWKRIGFMTIVFVISFYISLLLFGDFKTPRVMYLTELDRCPACYGVNVCPALYSNQITLESHTWSSIFNVKNIYYGYTKTKRRIVLKKLAHSSELKDFDSKLCSYWNLKKTCKPMNLLNVSNLDEKIINLVEYNLTTPVMEPRKGLIVCPYPYSIYDLVNPAIAERNGNYNSEMLNVWTMLKINPEPIILQVVLLHLRFFVALVTLSNIFIGISIILMACILSKQWNYQVAAGYMILLREEFGEC